MAAHRMVDIGEVGRRSIHVMLRNSGIVILIAALAGLMVGFAVSLVPAYHEFTDRLVEADERAEAAATLARINKLLQEETLVLLTQAIADSLPIIEPLNEDGHPADARQIPCEDIEDKPAVCGVELDVAARIIQLPEKCGAVQLRVTLLRMIPGSDPDLRSEIESWVVPDLLATLPPDGNIIKGTLRFTTLEPIFPVDVDDLAWSYFQRCGAASSITPFQRTVFDSPDQ